MHHQFAVFARAYHTKFHSNEIEPKTCWRRARPHTKQCIVEVRFITRNRTNRNKEERGLTIRENKFASKFIAINQPLDDFAEQRRVVHRRWRRKKKQKNAPNEPETKRIINENNRRSIHIVVVFVAVVVLFVCNAFLHWNKLRAKRCRTQHTHTHNSIIQFFSLSSIGRSVERLQSARLATYNNA